MQGRPARLGQDGGTYQFSRLGGDAEGACGCFTAFKAAEPSGLLISAVYSVVWLACTWLEIGKTFNRCDMARKCRASLDRHEQNMTRKSLKVGRKKTVLGIWRRTSTRSSIPRYANIHCCFSHDNREFCLSNRATSWLVQFAHMACTLGLGRVWCSVGLVVNQSSED